MNDKRTKPPVHLSKAAKQLWTQLCDEYALDDSAAQLLLTSALAGR